MTAKYQRKLNSNNKLHESVKWSNTYVLRGPEGKKEEMREKKIHEGLLGKNYQIRWKTLTHRSKKFTKPQMEWITNLSMSVEKQWQILDSTQKKKRHTTYTGEQQKECIWLVTRIRGGWKGMEWCFEVLT